MTPTDPGQPALAEEAARLIAAAQQWLAARTPAAASPSEGTAAASPSVCRGCPFCQLLTAVRDVDPAVVGHLADAMGSLGLAIREMLAEHTPSAPRRGESRVQHIDVG